MSKFLKCPFSSVELGVKYFDLRFKSFGKGTESIPLSYDTLFNDHHKVTIEIVEGGEYCYISGHTLVIRDTAPHGFTVKLRVIFEGLDSWADYTAGNAAYYLDEYIFTLNVVNHDWVLSDTLSYDETCEKDGLDVYECADAACTETHSDIIDDIDGHRYPTDIYGEIVWDIVDSVGDCSQKILPYRSVECDRLECDHLLTEYADELCHTWNEGEYQSATCDTYSYTLYTCKVCGETKKENYGTGYYHESLSDWHREDGKFCGDPWVITCNLCDAIVYIESESGLHTHAEESVSTFTQGDDCTAENRLYDKCADCGEKFNYRAEYTEHEIPEADDAWLYNSEIHCDVEGSKYKLCVNCSQIVYATVRGDGDHVKNENWLVNNNISCLEDGHLYKDCTVCQKILETSCVEEHRDDGKVYSDVSLSCGEVGSRYKQCPDCGEKYDHTDGEHTASDTLTDPEVDCMESGHFYTCCITCGAVMDGWAADAHSFGEWATDKNISCVTDKHRYRQCGSCGYVEFLTVYTEHDFVLSEVHEATCLEDGVEIYKCSRCPQYDYVTLVSPKDHDWSELLTYAPTEDETGYRYYKCLYCGDKDIIGEIPCLPYSDGLTYELNEDKTEAYVTGIDSAYFVGTEINIPPTFNGVPVVGISAEAFSGRTDITSVIIPDSVNSIGAKAFYGCSSLTTLTVGEGIDVIYNDAFSRCSALSDVYIPSLSVWCGIRFDVSGNGSAGNPLSGGARLYAGGMLVEELVIPEDITDIPDYAFMGCSSIKSVYIHGGVETVGASAFMSCDSLVTLTIENGVGSLGDSCFAYTALTGISIPDSVASVGAYAFRDCDSVTSINIGAGLSQIGKVAFGGCDAVASVTVSDRNSVLTAVGNCIINVSDSKLIAGFASSVIPDDGSVTVIGEYAFYELSYLTSLTIPEGIIKMESYAIYSCRSLDTLSLPTSLTKANNAWGTKGTDYDTDQYVYTEYGNALYLGNDSNPYVVLVQAVSTDITSCTIHPDTRIIYTRAFFNCTALAEIVIPEGIREIGYRAFYGCSALTKITYNAADCETPGYEAAIFNGAGSNALELTLVIGNKVTAIPDGLFKDCAALSEVSFESSPVCETIGSNAFSGCTALCSITLPSSVKRISDYAFYGCTSLNNAVIPGSIESIGSYAFGGCTSLVTLEINNSALTDIGSGAFYSCNIDKLYISDIGAWCAVSFGNSSANPMNGASELYVNGVLTTHIVIPEGTTHISKYAFYGCEAVTAVTVPSTVVSMGDYAFAYMSGVTDIYFNAARMDDLWESHHVFERMGVSSGFTVTFGAEVERVPSYLFYHYSSGYQSRLVGITFAVRSICAEIGEYAFFGNELLADVDVPSTLTYVGYGSFDMCAGLTGETSLNPYGSPVVYLGNDTDPYVILLHVHPLHVPTIQSGTRIIYHGAFKDNENISTVVLPDSVIFIGKYAFYKSSLKNISIPDSLIYLGDYAFSECKKLSPIEEDDCSYLGNDQNPYLILIEGSRWEKRAVINASTRFIHSGAFAGNTRIRSVRLHSDIAQIGSDAFSGCSSLTAIYVDSQSLASMLLSSEDFGSLTEYARSIIICSDIGEVSDYVTESFAHTSQICLGGKDYTVYADHECQWVFDSVVKEVVTCVSDGIDLHRCTVCEATKEVEVYCHLSLVWKEAEDATCTQSGVVSHFLCPDCGKTFDGEGNELESVISQAPIDHTYPEGKDKCTVCGHFRDGIASLYGYSLSLSGNIAINFYLEATPSTIADPDAYILITMPDGSTSTVLLSEARTKTGNGVTYYVVSPELPAKNIEGMIYAQIILGDGTEGISYGRSIEGYANAVMENVNAYDPALITLIEAMTAYGTAADKHFGSKEVEPEMTDITAQTLAQYAIRKNGSLNGMMYHGSSVLLESETRIRHYFLLTSTDIDDHMFYVDGVEVTPVREGTTSYWYIDIPNVASADLDLTYTLTVDDFTLEYSALSYAYAVLDKYPDSNHSLGNVAKALYRYSCAANDYFGR